MPLTKCKQPSKEIRKRVIEPSNDDSCRCGQGAKKDKKDTISCDVFKKKVQVLSGDQRLRKPIWEEQWRAREKQLHHWHKEKACSSNVI